MMLASVLTAAEVFQFNAIVVVLNIHMKHLFKDTFIESVKVMPSLNVSESVAPHPERTA